MWLKSGNHKEKIKNPLYRSHDLRKLAKAVTPTKDKKKRTKRLKLSKIITNSNSSTDERTENKSVPVVVAQLVQEIKPVEETKVKKPASNTQKNVYILVYLI